MYQLASHVRSVKDADGTTVLDISQNMILALNGTGAFIWEQLKQGSSLTAMVDALASAAGVDRSTVETDTQQFIEDLLQKRLVCVNERK